MTKRKYTYEKKKPWQKKKTGKIGFKATHFSRDYKEPIYVAWRQSVRARDKYSCQMPGCKASKRAIQVHHILPWSTHPQMRYVTNNGICLCVPCHKRIRGFEASYTALFMGIAARNEILNPQGPLKLEPRVFRKQYKSRMGRKKP